MGLLKPFWLVDSWQSSAVIYKGQGGILPVLNYQTLATAEKRTDQVGGFYTEESFPKNRVPRIASFVLRTMQHDDPILGGEGPEMRVERFLDVDME